MKLRETFGLEIATLNNPKGNFLHISNIIESRFIDQQMAVNEFRLFLTDKELSAFNKAWNEYYEYKCQSIELPFYREWKHISDPSEREKHINLIENIIALTAPK